MVTYPAIVGAVLRNAREERGQSQAAMASALGMSQANWSKIETGKSALTTSQLAKVAQVLNILPGDIVKTADDATNEARLKGFSVTYDEPIDSTLKILGAVAVLGLIAVAISKK